MYVKPDYSKFLDIPIDGVRIGKSKFVYEVAAKKLIALGFKVDIPEDGYELLVYDGIDSWSGQSHLLSDKIITLGFLVDEGWKNIYSSTPTDNIGLTFISQKTK